MFRFALYSLTLGSLFMAAGCGTTGPGATGSTIASMPDFRVTLPKSLSPATSSTQVQGLATSAVGEVFDINTYNGLKAQAWYDAVQAAEAPELAKLILGALEVVSFEHALDPGRTLDLTNSADVTFNGTFNMGYMQVEGTAESPVIYWKLPRENDNIWVRFSGTKDEEGLYDLVIDYQTGLGQTSHVRYDESEDESFVYSRCQPPASGLTSRECQRQETTVTSAYRPGREGRDISILTYSGGVKGYNDVENRVYETRRVVWGNDEYGGGLDRDIFPDEGEPSGISDTSSYFGENRNLEFYDSSGNVVWLNGTRASPLVDSATYTDLEVRLDIPLNQVSFDRAALGSLYVVWSDPDVPGDEFEMYFQQGDNRVDLSRSDIGYGTYYRYDPATDLNESVDIPFLARYNPNPQQRIDIDEWLANGIPAEFTFAVDSDTIDRYQTLEDDLATELASISTEAPYLPESALPTPNWNPDDLDDLTELSQFSGIEQRAVAP